MRWLKREPHGGELLVVATHPHVPADRAVVGAVDREDVVVLAAQRVEPPIDLTFDLGELFGVEDLDHVHDTRSRTVRSL